MNEFSDLIPNKQDQPVLPPPSSNEFADLIPKSKEQGRDVSKYPNILPFRYNATKHPEFGLAERSRKIKEGIESKGEIIRSGEPSLWQEKTPTFEANIPILGRTTPKSLVPFLGTAEKRITGEEEWLSPGTIMEPAAEIAQMYLGGKLLGAAGRAAKWAWMKRLPRGEVRPLEPRLELPAPSNIVEGEIVGEPIKQLPWMKPATESLLLTESPKIQPSLVTLEDRTVGIQPRPKEIGAAEKTTIPPIPKPISKPMTTLEAYAKGEKLTKEQAIETWEEYKRNVAKSMPEDPQEASNIGFDNQLLRETVEGFLKVGKMEALTPGQIDKQLYGISKK